MRACFVPLAVTFLITGLTHGQGPNAPANRPVWFASQGGQVAVYNAATMVEIAAGSANPTSAGAWAMDPNSQTNGFNTIVQVDNGRTTPPVILPSFMRYAVPLSPWPAAVQTVLGPGSSMVASQAAPLSIIISKQGELVSLEQYMGTTHLVRYTPSAAGWALAQFVSLGLPLTIGYVTVDYTTPPQGPRYWVVGYTPQFPQTFGLWSWVPSTGTLSFLGLSPTSLLPTEVPSWITTERPTTMCPQGLVHISTWFTNLDGYYLRTFDPATVTWPFIGGSVGGGQIWPATNASTGNGVWAVQIATGLGVPPPSRLVFTDVVTTCGSMARLASAPLGALQMDLDPVVGVSTMVLTFNGSMNPTYEQWSEPACPGVPVLLTPIRPAATAPFNLRGVGWNYPEYIQTS